MLKRRYRKKAVTGGKSRTWISRHSRGIITKGGLIVCDWGGWRSSLGVESISTGGETTANTNTCTSDNEVKEGFSNILRKEYEFLVYGKRRRE